MSASVRALMTAIVVLFTIVALSRPAHAYPYDIWADYTPNTGDAKHIKISLNPEQEAGAAVVNAAPNNPTDATFNGIFFQTKSDELSEQEVDRLWLLIIDIYSRDADAPVLVSRIIVQPEELKSHKLKTLVRHIETGTRDTVAAKSFQFKLYSKFTNDYLCYKERQLRAKGAHVSVGGFPKAFEHLPGQPQKQSDLPVPFDNKAFDPFDAAVLSLPKRTDPISEDDRKYIANAISAYSLLFEHGLKSDGAAPPDGSPALPEGKAILYTFCQPERQFIRFEALASILAGQDISTSNGGAALIEHAHQMHKYALARLIIAQMIKDGVSTNAEIEKDLTTEERGNVYSHTEYNVTMILDVSDLKFEEDATHESLDADGRVVDKNSRIIMSFGSRSTFCINVPNCNVVVQTRFGVTTAFPNKTGGTNEINAAIAQLGTGTLEAEGNYWTVAKDLSKFVHQYISFGLYFKADGSDKLTLLNAKNYAYTARVEALGLQTSFPVVSDIIAAAQKNPANPSDISIQSSIPVSWAISLTGHENAAHVAVTVPWMIGFNTRGIPNLEHIVRIFPSVSFVFPLSTQATPTRVAFGGGIQLVDSLTFSFANSPAPGVPETYFMLGLSATDIAKLAKAFPSKPSASSTPQ